MGPRGRCGQIFDIFELLRGADDVYNSISMPNYYHTCLPGAHRHPNASVAGIWSITSLKGKVLAPGGRDLGKIVPFLCFLVGLVIKISR